MDNFVFELYLKQFLEVFLPCLLWVLLCLLSLYSKNVKMIGLLAFKSSMHVIHIMANNNTVPYFTWFAEGVKRYPDVRFSFIILYS